MSITTWRREIQACMNFHGETFDDVVACTLSDEELDREFNSSYGSTDGSPFTLWTEKRVYFPACYDGYEWADSAPRNPCDEAMSHVGDEG